MSKITSFKKSFYPVVPLPGRGSCSHTRHFQNCARVVVQKLLHLVKWYNNPFVWAEPNWFHKHCKDWETKKPYDRRMISEVFRLLEQLGIIARACRIEDQREGWHVIDHESLTEIRGKHCMFCAATSHRASHGTSHKLPNTSHGTSHGDDKYFPSDFPPDFPLESAEGIQMPEDSGNGAEVVQGVVQDEKSLPILSSHLNTHNTHNLTDGKREDLADKESDSKPANPIRSFTSTADLTKTFPPADETVGKRVQAAKNNLELLIDLITDGEFETGALEAYDHIDTLREVCFEVVEGMRANLFIDRLTCVKIMERINKVIRDEHGVNPPKGWVPVLRKLKVGGAIKLPTSARDVFSCRAIWSLYQNELAPYKEILQAAEASFGVCRDTYKDAAEFLAKVADRLPEPIPALQAVRTAMMARVRVVAA